MNTLMRKAGLGIALAATTLSVAAPAEAQRYRRYHRGGGNVAAGAILGGIVGLGVGAAIASNNRGRYYDRGYYGGGYGRGYGGYGAYGGYGYGGGYYDQGYYAPPPRRFYRPYRGYGRPCVVRYRHDPYYGGVVPVTICR